jgi:ATP-dependent Clp protease ATP-binding subunit ClpA
MDMFERFTQPARQVVLDAKALARTLDHRHVGTEHLLLALVSQDAGAGAILRGAGLTADGVRAAITRILGKPSVISDQDAAALERIGIDIRAVRAKLEESFGPGALSPEVPPTRRGLFGRRIVRGPFTPRSKKVLELSLREALRLGHNWIGTEHILLGLIREGQGLAAQIMAESGVDFAGLRRTAEESLRRAA